MNLTDDLLKKAIKKYGLTNLSKLSTLFSIPISILKKRINLLLKKKNKILDYKIIKLNLEMKNQNNRIAEYCDLNGDFVFDRINELRGNKNLEKIDSQKFDKELFQKRIDNFKSRKNLRREFMNRKISKCDEKKKLSVEKNKLVFKTVRELLDAMPRPVHGDYDGGDE